MIDEPEPKGDKQVAKQKEMQNHFENTHINGSGLFGVGDFSASNYNKLQMQLNTQYISQIYCPRRVRSALPHVRMRPYYIPQRSRTKSETLDPSSLLYLDTIRTVDASLASQSNTIMETSDPSTSQMDTSGNQTVSRPGKCNSLVKSKSLEDLVRAIKSVDGSQPSHEMEFVSSRIQKLKVQE